MHIKGNFVSSVKFILLHSPHKCPKMFSGRYSAQNETWINSLVFTTSASKYIFFTPNISILLLTQTKNFVVWYLSDAVILEVILEFILFSKVYPRPCCQRSNLQRSCKIVNYIIISWILSFSVHQLFYNTSSIYFDILKCEWTGRLSPTLCTFVTSSE